MNEIPYNERAMILKKESTEVELPIINECLEEFEKFCKGVAANTINAANKSREIGIHIQAISSHALLEMLDWNQHFNGRIGCSLEQAKAHVSVARKMPQPARTIADCAQFVQTMLLTAGMIEGAPGRTTIQYPSSLNALRKFFLEITIIRKDFAKAIRTTPMKKWNQAELETFLSESEWLAKERNRALEILELMK